MADLGLTIETAQPSRPTGKNVAEGQSISVRRDAFLFEDNPGNALDKKKLTGKDNLTKSEYSEISPVVIDRIRTQLNQYMDNLANVYEKNPGLLDIPGHEHERQAWQLLGNADHDVRGAKIADFLGSTSGLKFADGLLQDLGSRKLQAAGVYATTNEPGERDDVVEPGVYRQGKDQGQGAANRAWHGTIRPKLHEIGPEEHLGKFRAVVGTLAGSAMAGADIGGRTDGLRGFVIGGGVGFAAGVAGLVGGNETGKLFRTGKTLETKRSVDALAALQANADEVAYYKIMYGIDLMGFDVNVADQTIRVAANADRQNITRMRDEGLQALELRRDLYKDLGVPEDRLDTTPELNLFESATLGGFEQSSSRVGRDILDAYYEGGVWDPAVHTLAENQDRMTKARSQVMTKLASEYIRNEQDVKNRSKDRPVATMRAKLGEYGGDDPAVMARRLKKENERKDKLTTEKTAREAELSQFKKSDEDGETLQKTAEELRQPPYSLPIPANPTSVDVNTIVNGQLTILNDSLRNRATPPTGLRVDLQTAQRDYNAELAAERRRLTTDARAGMGTKDTLSEETKRNIEKEAADHATFLHGADIERLTQEIAEVEKTIVDLKKLEETYRDTSKGLAEKQRELLVNAPKELVATHRSYDTLRRTAGATITDVLLESQTVDQLITMATVPPYSLPNGTPAEQAALRKMIIQAKSELKGRREEIVNPSPRDQKRAITEIALRTGLPITVDDLLTKPDAELIHLLSTNAAYAGLRAGIAARGSDIRSELALAKAEAAKRLRNRYRAELEEGIKDDEKQIEAIDTKAKDLTPTLNAEKVQIQTSLDMIDRQESLYIAAEKITHDVDMRDKITNLSTYKTADKAILSQSEQDLVDKKRVPRGYFELMDIFFDYRTRTDRNRSEYFSQISTVLPPDKLARLLNQSLGLGVRNSLPAVLTAMNTRIEAGTLDRKHLRIGFNAITDRLQEEALALS
jgi:hypothetical protein